MTQSQKPVVDLHTHSTASDGWLTPAQLVAEARRRGLRTLALTDHDTVAGIAPATQAAESTGIELIPGIELSSSSGPHEVHILGYFIDPSEPALLTRLEHLVAQRNERNRAIVERLNDLGMPIEYQRVEEIATGGTIGRPHIARAMIEQGYVGSIGQAFNEYLTRGKPAYVPRRKVLPEDAIALVKAAGGVAVLAHPMTAGELAPLLERLVTAGLAGMEVFYGEYDRSTRNHLQVIADRWNLIPTGGSDFHGEGFKEGRSLGSVEVPLASLERLRQAHRNGTRGSDSRG